MGSPRGAVLLVLILLAGYAITCSRVVFHDGGPPAFFLEDREGVSVVLGEGFPEPGLHQFSDGTSMGGVIEMTGMKISSTLTEDPRLNQALRSGEMIDILFADSQVVEIQRNWLPALQRMALGIPLHPDCMDFDDWQALSGIGPRLALRIEEDRQQNGEFGSLDGLKRVRGIGSRRIEAWRKFFSLSY